MGGASLQKEEVELIGSETPLVLLFETVVQSREPSPVIRNNDPWLELFAFLEIKQISGTGWCHTSDRWVTPPKDEAQKHLLPFADDIKQGANLAVLWGILDDLQWVCRRFSGDTFKVQRRLLKCSSKISQEAAFLLPFNCTKPKYRKTKLLM